MGVDCTLLALNLCFFLLFYGISENKAVKCDPLYENLVVNEKYY